MRVMGIDFGQARIGVAISDALGITAQGKETIYWDGKQLEPVLDRIVQLIAENAVTEIVLGLPKRTDGRKSEASEKVLVFSDQIFDKVGIQPELVDERFTTVIASQVLKDSNVRNKRAVIDQVAAEIILRDYLEKKRQIKP